MNLGDFTKQKLLNFLGFLETKFPEQARHAAARIEPLSTIAVLLLLDKNIRPCKHAIEQRDINLLANSLSDEMNVLGMQMADAYEDTPLEERDKFWRYLELFQHCINSKQ